jgi:ribonuclease HI
MTHFNIVDYKVDWKNTSIYVDGGVIGRNPSKLGGTWAYVVVDNQTDSIIQSDSGVVLPEHFSIVPRIEITNNISEYYAMMKGLLAVPTGYNGTIYSDSGVTIGRFFNGWKNTNVPNSLVATGLSLAKTLGENVKAVLLDGHPTKAQLAAGVGKRGHPVSKWNVYVDAKCSEEAKKFLSGHKKA